MAVMWAYILDDEAVAFRQRRIKYKKTCFKCI